MNANKRGFLPHSKSAFISVYLRFLKGFLPKPRGELFKTLRHARFTRASGGLSNCHYDSFHHKTRGRAFRPLNKAVVTGIFKKFHRSKTMTDGIMIG